MKSYLRHWTRYYLNAYLYIQDKTVNEWEERDSFEKRAGKYDLVLMDYSAKDEVCMYDMYNVYDHGRI